MQDVGFRNRRDAGRQLAQRLERLDALSEPVVLALPRGGVPVAYEVARALGAPLAPFLVRKLGIPGHEELAMGAIATGGIRVLDHDLIARLGIPPGAVERVVEAETRELRRRQAAYDGRYAIPSLEGRTVVLVDDGVATGASIVAAVEALRAYRPGAIVVAVPVAAAETAAALRRFVDAVVCVVETGQLDGVGSWYRDFRQTSDGEVRTLLAEASAAAEAAAAPPEVPRG
jgi:predicted phosphoribosyltransferase